ncbi:MAG: hypothetical protein ABI317_10755, partial [Gaiellales bacterium]
RATGIHPLIAFVAGGLAVWVVLTFVVAGGTHAHRSGHTSGSSSALELPAGPLDGSVVPAADAPTVPDGGPNAAALWVHDTALLPAAPIALLAAAGLPVEIVHDASSAFRHPLVLSWPRTDLSQHERDAFAAYSKRGGTLLAIAPDAVTREALVGRRGAVIARLASVPETGLQNGGLRDQQIAALRRWWTATPGGFRLGDAPAGRAQAVVFVHDVRSDAAIAAAPALALAEHELGVHATWPIETKYLSDEAGGPLVGRERSVVAAIRAAGGEVASGGVSGVDLARLGVGDGREAYPAYSPAQASPTQLVGASVLGEARVGRHLLGALGGGTSNVFRGVGRETAAGFAGALEAAGVTTDATLAATHAGGAFPFLQSESDGGVRPVLRFPVSFEALPGERLDQRVGAMMAIVLAHRRSGAPTLLAFEPAGAGRIAAERSVVRQLGGDAWIGSLETLASWWRVRDAMAVDVRPGPDGSGWVIRVTAPPGIAHAQTLVAPFDVASAATGDGRALPLYGSRRIALPDFSGTLEVQVARTVGS